MNQAHAMIAVHRMVRGRHPIDIDLLYLTLARVQAPGDSDVEVGDDTAWAARNTRYDDISCVSAFEEAKDALMELNDAALDEDDIDHDMAAVVLTDKEYNGNQLDCMSESSDGDDDMDGDDDDLEDRMEE